MLRLCMLGIWVQLSSVLPCCGRPLFCSMAWPSVTFSTKKRKTDTLSLLSVFVSSPCCPVTFNGASYFDSVAHMRGLHHLFGLGAVIFHGDPDIGFHWQGLNYGNQTPGNMWFHQSTNNEQRVAHTHTNDQRDWYSCPLQGESSVWSYSVFFFLFCSCVVLAATVSYGVVWWQHVQFTVIYTACYYVTSCYISCIIEHYWVITTSGTLWVCVCVCVMCMVNSDAGCVCFVHSQD